MYLVQYSGIMAINLLVLMVTRPTVTLQCTKIDACSCKIDDDVGSIVTLRPLLNESYRNKPLFLDQLGEDGLYYSYNPCLPFDEGECLDTAICQIEGVNGSTFSMFGLRDVQFGYDGGNVQISYLSEMLPIRAVVNLTCVDGLDPPVFTAYGYQKDSEQYEFLVESMCACKNVCQLLSPVSGGISAGTVVLIVFFVLVALYLIVGTINGKVVKKAQGLEMLPHYTFWAELPGTMKEGCLCLVGALCCRPRRKTYDEL